MKTHQKLKHMNSSGWQFLAWMIFIVMVLIVTGTVVSFTLMVSQGQSIFGATTVTGIVTVLSNGVVALLILNRYPSHTVGWLLLITGLIFDIRLLARIPLFLAIGGWLDVSTNLVMFVEWFEKWNYLPAFMIPICFLPLYFPTGTLPSKKWRIVPTVGSIAIVLIIIGIFLSPGDYFSIYDGLNPVYIVGGEYISDNLIFLFVPLLFFSIAGAILALFLRYRSSNGLERTQLNWLFLPIGIYSLWNFGVIAPIHFIEPEVVEAFHNASQYADFWLMSALIPIVIGIAILRHNLFDMEVAIDRAFVYGILTTLIILFYVVIVTLFGVLVQSQTTIVGGLIATGTIAVIFQPLRERVQKLVSRYIYGQRDEPEVVLSRLAQHLETSDTSSTILPNLVETIAQALKIPYVAILVVGEDDNLNTLAEYGKLPDQQDMIALTYHNKVIGQLVVSPRSPQEQFTKQERSLLNTIATLTATTLRSVQLAEELSQSRQRIVTAREEERRRIRRDLHDGLGPALAAHMIQIGSARASAKSDPEMTEIILEELESDLAQSLEDIRRLVYNLRPPILDQLGLVAALRDYIQQCNPLDEDHHVNFKLFIPTELPALPAAVEVAAYRIIQEAINNVFRHAQAQHSTIQLEWSDQLIITIEDDGIGIPSQVRYGVGLNSMRERTEELGGHFKIQSQGTRGTAILAELPV